MRDFIRILIMIAISLTTSLFSVTNGLTAPTRNSNTALQLPNYYPARFDAMGVLINKQSSRDWIISGKIYSVSNSLKVYMLSSESGSNYQIRTGMEVGFNLDNNNVITAIWELPSNTVKRH